METFIIENNNLSYIYSLLIVLFYETTKLNNLLDINIDSPLGIYLQEYIKYIFMLIHDEKSILQKDIEIIKTLCIKLGWKIKSDSHINDFYIFLTNLLGNEQIEIKDNEKIECFPIIQLSLPGNITHIKISALLHNWLHQNANSYYINNVPYVIALSIDRSNNDDANVIIQKRISSNKHDIINNNKWDFHAAICRNENDHHYVLLLSKTKWYIFDDLLTPCLREIRMDDQEITSNLKRECVFILYKRPGNIFGSFK